MIVLNAYLDLKFSKSGINSIKKALAKEAVKEISNKLNSSKNILQDFIRNIIRSNLIDSPEVRSIMDDSGKLRLELGVKNGDTDIIQIINHVVNKTEIRISKKPPSEIEIEIYIDASYEDFYSQTYASYVTESGVKIEWLNWLLEAGNKDIIFGYRIRYGVGVGRVGDVIMTPSKTANWRVPPEFSGVADNNFITRSFENVENELSKFIESILK